jgi:serine phosphatase RsbU (regulator of sigma subunit)
MLENGKILEGHLALALHSDYSFVLGKPLPKILQDMEVQLKVAQRHHNLIVERQYLLHIQFALNLMGRGNQCDVYRGPVINSLEALPLYINENDKLSLCTLTILEGLNQIIFQNYPEAYKNLIALAPHSRPLAGLYVRISYFYVLSLATLGVCTKASRRDRKKYLAEARSYIKNIKSAARECPENYNYYYELCAAEWYRLKGNVQKATSYFKKAVHSCHQQNVGFLEALSNEYFARFWDDLGEKIATKSYRDRARNLYEAWGATEKVRLLRQIDETAMDTPIPTASTGLKSPKDPFDIKPDGLGTQLDAHTLIQASQSLSSQIQLGDLLKKLLHLALSHSGATQGFLALIQGESLIVKMLGKSYPVEEITATSLLIEDYPSVSRRILQKVVRSKKTLVLNDACHSGGFTSDPYILSQSVRSLLCLPILNKGDLVALLWMEHTNLSDVFTNEVLMFLNILVAQGAISIKNADYLLSLTEKARLEGNVSAAQAVQNSLLPLSNPPPEVSIALYYKAAEQIGGDWASYEYDPDRSRIYLCIGDVTGHGIPSAVLTAAAAGAVKAILWDLCHQSADLSMEHCLESIAHSVNRTVRDIGQPVGRSMTMVFVALDLQTGAGAFMNAGHLPILHISEGRASSLAAPGTLLGFEENPPFSALPFKMALGDRLFLYTDGLTENRGLQGQSLRYLELRKILQKYPQPSDASENICKKIEEIWGQKTPEDDCSFLILRWNHLHSEILRASESVALLDREAG